MVSPSEIYGSVTAPPSKSYTHRAVALAAITEEETRIYTPLLSRDTRASIRAAKMLGSEVAMDDDFLRVVGRERLSCPADVIDVENSGTSLRIFTALSALVGDGYTVLTGDDSIRRRPIQPLLDALRMLGVDCWTTRGTGTAPVVVKGGGIKGGYAEIIGWESSQYVTAILVAGLRASGKVILRVEGHTVSRPYIDATIKTVERFGGRIAREGYSYFEVEPQPLRGISFQVPGDFGAASFIIAAAYLAGGEVLIRNLDPSLPQADSAIVGYAEAFGCKIGYVDGGLRVIPDRSSGELALNLSDSPDLLPVLAVMAVARPATTHLTGVSHARLKESDRVNALAVQLRRLGIDVREREDGLTIRGQDEIEGGLILESYGDHRLFMAFTVLGLACKKGLTVEGAESADVSYPNFLEDLSRIGARLKIT
ncbi:MAG: 3-phosphoshikimate 1-carboxyvinyltransferase [Nitrososphaerota archaeon]